MWKRLAIISVIAVMETDLKTNCELAANVMAVDLCIKHVLGVMAVVAVPPNE